jgi:hypothetical protein
MMHTLRRESDCFAIFLRFFCCSFWVSLKRDVGDAWPRSASSAITRVVH